MTILSVVYASAPTDEVIIPTLEILTDDPQRICGDFADHEVTLETGEEVTFIGAGIDVSLPAADTSGQQKLAFAIDNVTGEAQVQIEAALEADQRVPVIYRPYLASDLSAPAEPPIRMTLVGGGFEGGHLELQGAYYDLLNIAWPREQYTVEFAPGLKYFT